MEGRDFFEIAEKLDEAANSFELRFKPQLKMILDAAGTIHEAWSGSNLGYQANVYYDGFRKRPAGACFSVMYGFEDSILSDTVGD